MQFLKRKVGTPFAKAVWGKNKSSLRPSQIFQERDELLRKLPAHCHSFLKKGGLAKPGRWCSWNEAFPGCLVSKDDVVMFIAVLRLAGFSPTPKVGVLVFTTHRQNRAPAHTHNTHNTHHTRQLPPPARTRHLPPSQKLRFGFALISF